MKIPYLKLSATTTLIVLFSNFIHAEKPIAASYSFHTYGLMRGPQRNDNAQDIVNQKWKIKYIAVAGCVITDEIAQKAKRNNDSVGAELTKVYGADWKEKLEKATKEEELKDQKVYELCNKNPDVKALHLNDQEKNYILTTANSKQYLVQVTSYPERTALLTLRVDLDKNSVTKIIPTN